MNHLRLFRDEIELNLTARVTVSLICSHADLFHIQVCYRVLHLLHYAT